MSTSSYDIRQHNRSLEAELQRLQTQASMSWPKEARTLSWFGLQDGMSVVELGSGPGFTTEQLCQLLPNSSLTAVERDALMIDQARQYLPTSLANQVTWVEASVTETGLPDDEFDFAIARLLFQHLNDPVSAAQEIFRILKPGGKLVIIDTDADIFGLFDPPNPIFQVAIDKFSQASAALGGNFRISRHLWRILKTAGFEHLALESILVHSDELGIEPFRKHPFDLDLFLRLVKMGIVNEEELASWQEAKEEFFASANPYVLLLWWMACGEKPISQTI